MAAQRNDNDGTIFVKVGALIESFVRLGLKLKRWSIRPGQSFGVGSYDVTFGLNLRIVRELQFFASQQDG